MTLGSALTPFLFGLLIGWFITYLYFTAPRAKE